MRQVKKILTCMFWSLMGLTLAVVVLFEADVLPAGMCSELATAEFLSRCTMEVVSLLCVWLALRLFRFQRVQEDLESRQWEGLRKWGVIRLSMLEVPMFVNTILYYVYMQTTYGYMAIILSLTLPFVYPSAGRCTGDVEDAQATGSTPAETGSQAPAEPGEKQK